MIKQIKKSSLTIALVIVVALSAVLSASVWINPFHYERERRGQHEWNLGAPRHRSIPE